MWSQSVDAWKNALGCLPQDESATELDKRLQVQFSESLKEAEEALNTPINPSFYTAPKGTELPWHRAKDLEQKFIAANKLSSVSLTVDFMNTIWVDNFPTRPSSSYEPMK